MCFALILPWVTHENAYITLITRGFFCKGHHDPLTSFFFLCYLMPACVHACKSIMSITRGMENVFFSPTRFKRTGRGWMSYSTCTNLTLYRLYNLYILHVPTCRSNHRRACMVVYNPYGAVLNCCRFVLWCIQTISRKYICEGVTVLEHGNVRVWGCDSVTVLLILRYSRGAVDWHKTPSDNYTFVQHLRTGDIIVE